MKGFFAAKRVSIDRRLLLKHLGVLFAIATEISICAAAPSDDAKATDTFLYVIKQMKDALDSLKELVIRFQEIGKQMADAAARDRLRSDLAELSNKLLRLQQTKSALLRTVQRTDGKRSRELMAAAQEVNDELGSVSSFLRDRIFPNLIGQDKLLCFDASENLRKAMDRKHGFYEAFVYSMEHGGVVNVGQVLAEGNAAIDGLSAVRKSLEQVIASLAQQS